MEIGGRWSYSDWRRDLDQRRKQIKRCPEDDGGQRRDFAGEPYGRSRKRTERALSAVDVATQRTGGRPLYPGYPHTKRARAADRGRKTPFAHARHLPGQPADERPPRRQPDPVPPRPQARARGRRSDRRDQCFQNSRDASLAPSAIAFIFAHTTSGSTAACPTQVPNPQSLPAITFSRPTSFA